MFTVTSKLNYDRLRQEQNMVQFKEILATNQLNNLQKAVEGMESWAGGDKDALQMIKDEVEYKNLVAEETVYETQIDNFDLELEMLDDQIKNYEGAIQDGIEQSTKTGLWAIGGG